MSNIRKLAQARPTMPAVTNSVPYVRTDADAKRVTRLTLSLTCLESRDKAASIIIEKLSGASTFCLSGQDQRCLDFVSADHTG